MYLRAPVVTSAMVLAFTGIFALIYPPSLLRARQAYLGGPVSDKDLELRLEASAKFGYLPTDNEAWNSTSEGCGFRYNFNTETGAFGREVALDDGQVCLQEKSLDLYAVQGVEISVPYENLTAANDTTYCEGIFCWYRFSSIPLLRHTFDLGDVQFDVLGVSPENLNTWEVEGLLEIIDIRGPYALANMYNLCTGSSSAGFDCSVVFDLWNDPVVVEPSSASAGKELAAAKLDSLVQNGDVLVDESLDASRAICNSFEGNEVMCDIECTIHYPYSSSLCAGSVEIEEIGDLPYSTSIGVLSLFLAVAVLLAKPFRECLMMCNSGGSSPQADVNPVGRVPSLTTSQSYSLSQSGASYSGRQAGPIPVGSIATGAAAIPLRSWPGCVALLRGEGVGGVVRAGDDSVILAFCTSNRGTVRNATECEAMAMLEPAQRKEFAAASRNGNTIEWASAFSLYHCISCVWMYGVLTHIAVVSGWGAFYWLLALFTYTGFNQETSLGTVGRACRFRGKVLPYSTRGEEVVLPTLLGAAQLWYELELPYGWALSWGIFFVVVVAVAANAILVTSVYNCLPTADSTQGVTRTSWSVEDAMELCRSSGSRFGMAGDWVERSRCGDIAGRTALMTSLGYVVPNRGSRLGHVYTRSQTSWAASATGGQPTHEYGSGREQFGDLGVAEEHMILHCPGEAVMVCAGLEEPE